jgi:hypothetical protein
MTHNIGGDNGDVWPWLGDSESEAKSNGGSDARFNIAKLQEWLELFEYMQNKGVVTYLVLEDDSAWTDYDHARYYRELIARFGHMPALIFNFCEEYGESYGLSSALSYMAQLKSIDPYNHPRGIHNVNSPNDSYINSSAVDFTAIQTKGSDPLEHNQITIDWINSCRNNNKRILVVGFDEPRPLMEREGWWSAYMGGGVWEVHVDKSYDRPMSTWEPAWTEIGGARAFMETLPFWEMEPRNDLVVSGNAFCLAKEKKAYAMYLPDGGNVRINLSQGVYEYGWWNPANGINGSFQDKGTVNGGIQEFVAPNGSDWALRIVISDAGDNTPPSAPTGLRIINEN